MASRINNGISKGIESTRRFMEYSGMSPAELFQIGVALGFVITQLPSNIFPEGLVDRFFKMRGEDGEPLKLKPRTQQRFDVELCQSGIANDYIINAKTFVCRNNEIVGRGFLAGKFRCMIGMPLHFDFETQADVEAGKELVLAYKRPLIFQNLYNNNNVDDPRKNVDWTSPAGVAFKESLLLSPNAKRFAMTRTINELDTSHLVLGGITALVGTELGRQHYKFWDRRMTKVERRMKKYRNFLASCLVGGLCWFVAVKIRNNNTAKKSDEYAAYIGPDYAAGGVEYYDKMLTRNRALRDLLGDEGKKRFTATGNVKTSFRSWIVDFNLPIYHRPITARKNIVDKIAEDFSSMGLEELKEHLEVIALMREPQKVMMPMHGRKWKSKETIFWEESTGVLEHEAQQIEKERAEKEGEEDS